MELNTNEFLSIEQNGTLPPRRNKTQKNSSSNKNFLIFLVAFLILIILLCFTITLLIKTQKSLDSIKKESNDYPPSRTNQECRTNTCFKASNFILDNLNQTIEPCDNFYQFSCGTWINDKNHIEKDHFTIAYDIMLADLSEILTEKIDPTSDSYLSTNFKLFYQSCLNQTDTEFNSDKHFFDFMSKEFGKWPLVQQNNHLSAENISLNYSSQSQFGFEEHLSKLTSLKMPLLFRFESDDFNHTKILMKIVIPEDFCIMQNFFPNTTKSKLEFKKLVKNIRSFMLEALSITKSHLSSVDEQIDEVLSLANQIYFLNNIQYRCGRRSKSIVHVLRLDELDNILNQNFTKLAIFDFQKYVFYLNENASRKLKNDTQIVISSLGLNYLKDLLNGLVSLNFTSEKFQRGFTNLVYFHTIFSLIKPVEVFSTPHIHVVFPIRYYNAFFEYSKHVGGSTPADNFEMIYRINRDQNCAYSVIDAFSVVDSNEQKELQRLFLSKKFDLRIKNQSNQILQKLIKTSIEVIQKQDWIDNVTKVNIEEHINQMEHKIVYSDSIFEKRHKRNDKENYNLTSSYLINKLIQRKKSYSKEFDLLDAVQTLRIRNKKYVFDIFLANLIYLKEYNTLLMPAGVLIEPIFDANNPIYLNYATIGAYLSHEIFHMIHEDMLSAEKSTKLNYLHRLECLRMNYVHYAKSMYDFDISGDTSITEQIADTFGILVSYKTFLKEMEASFSLMDQSLLPGLRYDQEQLFFIRYTQSYCRKRKISTVINFEQFHVVHEFRAFQVSLIPEFSDVFKCGRNFLNNSKVNKNLVQCKIFDI